MGVSLAFHALIDGSCTIEAGGVSVVATAGDIVLVPHGRGHTIRTAPQALTPSIFDLPHEYLSDRYATVQHGYLDPLAAPVTLVCGAVECEHPAGRSLLAALPAFVHVRAALNGEVSEVRSLIDIMGAEARALRPGGESVLTRLCDIVVILAIRDWLDQDPAAMRGWLGAIGDPHVGAAIAAVHRQPADHWSVASLAAVAAMSRSAFAARFTELVGKPPLAYLTFWRMQIAVDRLRAGNVSVAAVAAEVGYASEAGFSRAFSRAHGYPPSHVARHAAPRGSTDAVGPR